MTAADATAAELAAVESTVLDVYRFGFLAGAAAALQAVAPATPTTELGVDALIDLTVAAAESLFDCGHDLDDDPLDRAEVLAAAAAYVRMQRDSRGESR